MNERCVNIPLKYFRFVIISLNVLLGVTSLSIYFTFRMDSYVNILNQSIPTISIILIFVSAYYTMVEQKYIMHKCINKELASINSGFSDKVCWEILGELTNNYLNNNLPPKLIDSKTSSKRTQNRKKLVVLYVLSFVIGVLISLFFFRIQIFIISSCIFILLCIYADYFEHVNRYAKEYDSRTITSFEKTNKYRGLAKLYLEEYEQTKFNDDSKFYDELENREHSLDCKKHILQMDIDQVKNKGIIVSLLLMLLNLMLTIPITEKYLTYLFDILQVGMRGEFIYNFVYFFVMIITVVLNILSCCEEKNVEIHVKKTLMTYMDNCSKYDAEYRNISDEISKLIECRGVFQYTIKRLDENVFIEQVAWKDRMLFGHRMYTHIPRLKLTMLLSGIIAVSLSSLFWGLCWWYVLYILLVFVLYRILLKYYLPKAGKKKIVNWCIYLEKQKQEKE